MKKSPRGELHDQRCLCKAIRAEYEAAHLTPTLSLACRDAERRMKLLSTALPEPADDRTMTRSCTGIFFVWSAGKLMMLPPDRLDEFSTATSAALAPFTAF
jgi:hypothetical protein